MPMPSARKVIRIALSVLCALVIVPVVGGFFIEWAKERGWYDRPSEKIGAVMEFLTSAEIRMIALFLSGLAIGLWLDWMLRNHPSTLREGASSRTAQKSPNASAPGENAPRQFVDVTPLFLMNIYDGHTDLQAEELRKPYIGRWLKVSWPLKNVSSPKNTYDSTFTKSKSTMRITLVPPDKDAYYLQLVTFQFNEEWFERLKVIPIGAPVSVIGRIETFNKFGLDLVDCELA